jgi:hypothetical protein
VRGAEVHGSRFAALFNMPRLEELKLEQAESAARFALRHNGQMPVHRLLGATRALTAAMTALRGERAERVERELRGERAVAAEVDAGRAGRDLAVGFATMSISPQPLTFSAGSDESGTTTSAASSGSSAGASGAGEERRCACPGCPNGGGNMCGACDSVAYCSRACQKLHWPAHKAVCKVKCLGTNK